MPEYIKKFDVWMPYELTARNLMNPIQIFDTMLKHTQMESFFKILITDDKNWIK